MLGVYSVLCVYLWHYDVAKSLVTVTTTVSCYIPKPNVSDIRTSTCKNQPSTSVAEYSVYICNHYNIITLLVFTRDVRK